MYSLTYKVTTSTCDSEGKLKLYSALQMMQDCSEMWIDSEPEVKDYFLQQNMAQLLATRQVEIEREDDDPHTHLANSHLGIFGFCLFVAFMTIALLIAGNLQFRVY